MTSYVGFDVSLAETSVCVLNAGGKVRFEGKVKSRPDDLIACVREHAGDAERIGLETGQTSALLFRAMEAAELPVVCIETRHAHILSEGEAVEDEAGEQSKVPRGRVRISAPLSFGIAYLGATLPGFLQAYPEITVDFALSDRKVDLVAEGFDLALRIASLNDSSLLSRRLCTVRLLLVGSPDYLDRHGMPTHPAELSRHCALAYTGGASRMWRFTHPTFDEERIEPPVRVWTDNADLPNPALVAGQGLAIQPEFLVWRELREGKLAIAMPEWSVPPLGLHLVMPPSPLRPLRVQVLVDYLARKLANAPWGCS